MDSRPVSFHAHHSPVGAYGSLTLGLFNANGGFALEKGSPADQAVYVGWIQGGRGRMFPFYKGASDEEAAYHAGAKASDELIRPFAADEIAREYGWATDSFRAPAIRFDILSPFYRLTEIRLADRETLQRESCPALWLRLHFDNRGGKEPLTGVFGIQAPEKSRRPLESADDLKGFQFGEDRLAFGSRDADRTFMGFSLQAVVKNPARPPQHRLGGSMGLLFDVPPGQAREVMVLAAFHRGGLVTTGIEAEYEYARHFPTAASVLDYAHEKRAWYLEEAAKRDRELEATPCSADQRWLIAHATRSYWGNTQWLRAGGEPLWVVNEGEYRMLNTFDLTVDQVFWELAFSPWTVRNELEWFHRRYAYVDEVYLPGAYGARVPGGLSFTHDMGVANHFTPPGLSSYELGGLDRLCFSYMTHEQLVNWVLCAALYLHETGDREFLLRHGPTLSACLESLLRRDHPDEARRDGVMKLESSRCEGGGEITTYDSLDHSLGQSRQNLYLAVKGWAAYLALEKVLGGSGNGAQALQARRGAERAARTIAAAFDEKKGFIPALLDGKSESAILPGIEGLVFPYRLGLADALSESGPYGALLRALKRHFVNILKPGICLYDDGGWKLSSTADNSWMSKICLCQYVAREVLGIPAQDGGRADAAHVRWEAVGSADQACSDQFSSGVARGSKYYPRIVTTWLWTTERKPA
ncbi:MAG: beta-xylosidase [Spirochaetes bacterium]|nr:beta-xylosidase [Spirochaetota bacterium]